VPTKTILIVEDEPALQKTLVTQMHKLGYETLTASDGVEALKIISNKNPDLILLDVIMPLKNGFDVLQDLRLKQGKQTPVIVITNLESKQDLDSAKNLGVSYYITKSNISLRDLSQTVNQALIESDKPDQKQNS
jgi:CheY-like chemotaxis protein